MYKKIAGILTSEDLADLRSELEDRFGDIPKVTQSLLQISYIRSLAEELDLRRVRVVKNRLILDYGSRSGIAPLTLFLEGGRHMLEEVIEILEIMKKKNEEGNEANAVS